MKKDRIIYWNLTGLTATAFLLSGFLYLSKSAVIRQNFKQLGYPDYFVVLLGIAKVAGAITLINPWFPKLKEWAYAGFSFALIRATRKHIATQTPFIAPLLFLGILLGSYYVYNKAIHATTRSR
jgi:uncharacterized membrane protein YphA (DoxX/SURF4 family)